MASRISDRRAGLIRAAILVLALVLAVGCGYGDGQQALGEKARNLYLTNCARCHQEDGSGFAPIYPNLDGNPIVTLHDADPVIEVVLEGRGGMPAFRGAMEREELAQVISYIRQAWGNDASVVEPKEVR